MNPEQREKIEQLYLEMYDTLMAYARACMENEAQAEEAVQETFWVACLKPNALCKSANPQGWLLRTLKNNVRNLNRKRENARKLLARYLLAQYNAVDFTEDKLRVEVLYDHVADTEEFRLLKELAIDGRSCLEMAQARGISVEACRKRIQRAKERLQKRIKKF